MYVFRNHTSSRKTPGSSVVSVVPLPAWTDGVYNIFAIFKFSYIYFTIENK